MTFSVGQQSSVSQALIVGLPVGVVAVLSEALSAALGTAHPIRDTLLLVLYLAWLGVIVSVGVGAVVLVLRRPTMRKWLGSSPYTLLVLDGLLIGVYLVHRWADQFHNRELAALLVAVSTLALLSAGGVFRFMSERIMNWVRRSREWPDWQARLFSWVVAVVVTIACGALLLWENREGFTQLSASIFVTPALALVVAGIIYVWGPRGMRIGVRGTWLGLFLAFVTSWTSGTLAPHLPGALVSQGGWSGMTVQLVHAATDIDGDGYSSLMGGGDCQPFNPNVNPGAKDEPNDGVDNNCNGVDAADTRRVAPTWVDMPEHPRWNVVYVSVEALRPDHLSLLGYERETTPNLEKIGETAVVFERAYSPSTLTRWAVPSILSSLPPSRVPFTSRKEQKRLQIEPDLPWLPAILHDAGYETAAVHAGFGAFTKSKGWGLQLGFDTYDAKTKLTYRGGTMQGFPGQEQLKRAKRILRKMKSPFFLWVHFVEPHYRYERHKNAPDFGKSPEDRYDSEVWMADSYIGELYRELKKRKVWDSTIFVVTGDHGEEFGEHGKRFHGSNLYDPQVRTLLLLRVPGITARRVSTPVVLNELPPTLLNLLDIQQPFERMESRNLVPLLQGAPELDGSLVLEVFSTRSYKNYRAALVRWPYKAMFSEVGGQLDVFDLSSDPEEKAELNDDHPQAARVERELREYLDSSARHTR